MKLKAFLVAIGVMGAVTAWGADALLSHRIVPETAHVGDVLTYTLILKTDAETLPEELPALKDKWGDFLILSTTLNRHSEPPVIVWTYQAKIIALNVGELWFPTLKMSVKTPQGIQVRTLDALPVKVTPVYEQGQGLKPAKPLYSLAFPWVPYSIAFGIVLVLLIVMLSVAWRWWRRRQGQLNYAKLPEISAKEWAILALSQLYKEKLRSAGKHSEYYFRITEILKIFLSKALKESLEECTTEEVITIIDPLLDEQLIRRIQQVMALGDLAKFAQYIPSETEHDDMMNRLEIILERVGT